MLHLVVSFLKLIQLVQINFLTRSVAPAYLLLASACDGIYLAIRDT